MSSVFENVLGTSILAADTAGNTVREIMKGGNLEIVQKVSLKMISLKCLLKTQIWFQTGEDDLQTAADRIVNDIIVGSLRRKFPGLAVIGEEGIFDFLNPTLKILLAL